MYTLVSSLVKDRHWEDIDISQLSLAQIDSKYESVYLRVSSPFWAKDRTMIYSEVTNGYARRTDTIQQFFDAKGNLTLDSIDGLASIGAGLVKYADAYWAGYHVIAGKDNVAPDIPVGASEADTLILSKPGVDGRIFHKNCLVSVNGIVHNSDADERYIYVKDGGTSVYHTRNNAIGIYNFKDVGEISKYPITPDLLFKVVDQQPFSNQIFIKAPADSANKTVALVFGGYLHLLDSLTFFRVGENTFCIDTQSIPLVERFIESRELIDTSALELDFNGDHKAQFSREQLLSDETLTKWLGMSQSFLVYIDSNNVTVDKEALPKTVFANQYITYKDNTLPLVGGYGLLQAYWKYEDDNQFSITVGNNIRPNYLFRTTRLSDVPNPADNKVPYDNQEYNTSYFWSISSEKIVITPN